ncbi:uncharacterized protein AMSG_00498, partial [Thecamonas trahens ATCC 50062]
NCGDISTDPDFGIPTASQVLCTGSTYNSSCTYTCNTGFLAVGTSTYTCGPGGLGDWQPHPLSFFCSATDVTQTLVDAPPLGTVYQAGESFSIGVVARNSLGSVVDTGDDLMEVTLPDFGIVAVGSYAGYGACHLAPLTYVVVPAAAAAAGSEVSGSALTEGSFSGATVTLTIVVRDLYGNARVSSDDAGLIEVVPKRGALSLPVSLGNLGSAEYMASFTPVEGGLYTISVVVNGLAPLGSVVDTGDDLMEVTLPDFGIVAVGSYAGYGGIYNISVDMTGAADTAPALAGTYQATMLVNKREHAISPLTYVVVPAAAAAAGSEVSGSALTEGSFSGATVTLTIVVRDLYGNARVSSDDAGLIEVVPKRGALSLPVSLGNLGSAEYMASFTPVEGGLYTISVVVNGLPHPSSPWVIVVSAICPPGFQSVDESTCAECPENTFSEVINAGRCELCPENMRSPSISPSWANCTCAPNFWLGLEGHRRNAGCVACPRGGECRGGLAPPVAAKGFFDVSPNGDGSQFEQCRRPGACAGGFQQCAAGFEGFMCNTCSANHYSDGSGACRKCPPGSSGLMIAFVLAIVVTAIGVVVFMLLTYAGEATAIADGQGALVTAEMRYTRGSYSHRRRVPHSLSQAIVFFQILGVIAKSSLQWPSRVQETLLIFNVINLDLDIFASECSLSSFEAKYALSTLYPLFFLLISTLAWILIKSVRYSFARLRTLPAFDAPTLIVLERTVIIVAPLLYIPLSRSSLILFDCSRLADGNYYLDADLGRRCFDAAWLRLLPLGLIAVCIYVIGIPLYIGLPLLFKRLVVVGASLFFSEAQIWQVSALLALFTTATVLHSQHEPYYEPLYNKLELRLNVCAMIVLGFGFAFYADRFPNEVSRYIFIIGCIAVVVTAVAILAWTFLVELRALFKLHKNPDAEFDLDVRQIIFWRELEKNAPDWVNKSLVEHILTYRGELNEDQRSMLKLDESVASVSIGIDDSLNLVASADASSRNSVVIPASVDIYATDAGNDAGAGVGLTDSLLSKPHTLAAPGSSLAATAALDDGDGIPLVSLNDDVVYTTHNVFDDLDADIIVE